jgi:hypothetical protein
LEANSLDGVTERIRLGGKFANQSQGMKSRWSGPIWNPHAGKKRRARLREREFPSKG